ncbi:MAG: DUF465 domain-containing protein [Pseudomonadota bacterium]
MTDEPPKTAGANDEALRLLLERIRQEHRDLDDAILAMEASPGGANRLAAQRLKKRKLGLKDQIRQIEDRLNPDIIA